MKKGIAKFTAFCLTAGFAFGQGGALVRAEDVKETSAVQTDLIGTNGFAQCSEYLNVRSEAAQEGELVGLIPNNGIMEILDADENGWYRVRSGNVEGYVAAQFVATGAKADEIAATAGYTTAEVGALSLNVRAEASDTSEIVGAVEENEKVEVTEDNGDWIRVVLEDGTYGYVSHDYVYVSTEYRKGETLEEIQARLDAQDSNTADASENAPSETAVPDSNTGSDTFSDTSYQEENTDFDDSWEDTSGADSSGTDDSSSEDTSSGESSWEDTDSGEDSWENPSGSDSSGSDDTASEDVSSDDTSEDTTSDGIYGEDGSDSSGAESGDISSDDVYEEEGTESDGSGDTGSSDASSTGQAIADYACQFIGNPYVWGGTSLTSGADCSGFTMAVYSNFGVSLPHNAASQSGYGTSVSADSLLPGDLVFYSDGSGISHVAIYIGGGQIVHAANSSSGIITSSMYYSTPTCYRRLV